MEQGPLADIAVGIIGAIIGGSVARVFGWGSVTGINMTSFIIALVGAVILLLIVKMFQVRE